VFIVYKQLGRKIYQFRTDKQEMIIPEIPAAGIPGSYHHNH